jgi:F0F1-type ATP synthase epsilon subunit
VQDALSEIMNAYNKPKCRAIAVAGGFVEVRPEFVTIPELGVSDGGDADQCCTQ